MLKMYDVAIIGSGCAGAASAFTCVANGLSTVVFTGEDKPTFYPNSDVSHSLHEGVLVLAKKLGLFNVFYDSILHEFNHVKVQSVLGTVSEINSNWFGYHICKKKLDKDLKNTLYENRKLRTIFGKAKKLTFSNNSYTIQSNSEAIQAEYIIDASGRAQWLGRLNKLRSKKLSKPTISITARVNRSQLPINNSFTNCKMEAPEFFFRDDGWVWRSNDSIECPTWTQLVIPALHRNTSNQLSSAFKIASGQKNRIFDTTWNVYRPLIKNNIFLVGDAGAILDPSSGQGIFNAIVSGINAANCITHSLLQPKNANMHQFAYDSWFYEFILEKARVLSKLYIENGLDITS